MRRDREDAHRGMVKRRKLTTVNRVDDWVRGSWFGASS
jgi:hypothetical protein